MRENFPFFQTHSDLIYLDSAATTHKPKAVIDALTQFYSSDYATVHRSIYRSSMIASEQYEMARNVVQEFINAKSREEIIFTRGTTDSLNLVAQSYGALLKEGDEILLSPMEHHSNLVPWQMLAKRRNLKLVWMEMNHEGILTWKNKITERTKILAVAHESNVTGTIHPIQEMAQMVHQVGGVIVVDGAQAASHLQVDVQKMGVDFYAFSSHKCYGPTGLGVLYGKYDLLEAMDPIQGGGDMIEKVDLLNSTYQKPPLKFEAGTPHIGAVIAFQQAIAFINEVGKERLFDHGKRLMKRAKEGLSTIASLHILGDALERGPLLSFYVDHLHSLDLVSYLDLKNIAIRSGHLCAQPTLQFYGVESVARASFAIYNQMEEVDLFVTRVDEAIKKF